MAVTKEKNGTYKVQYYRTNLDGTRTLTTKRGFTRKSEAEVFDCEMKKRSRKKKIDVGAMFLEDFINQLYFPHIENNLKEKSVINKKNVINEHILNVKNKPISSFKNMKLREITAKAIEDWQIAKQKEDYSKAYLLSMRKELSAVLNFAMNRYGWEDNPSKNVPRMGEFDTSVRKDDWWTIDEFDTFISQIDKDSRYYVIWNVLFYSGIRLGELLALKREDVSVDNSCIYIDETYARLNQKDILTDPKTDSSKRVVYLPSDTIGILGNYLHKHPDIQECDRIFPIGHRAVEKAFARAIKKSNLRYITVHCLRHSHTAYLLSLNSFSMSVISKRLGHKNEKITSQVYAHVYNSDAMNVAKGMQKNMYMRKSKKENNT